MTTTIEHAPVGVGLYTVTDAGRLTRTPRNTVARWVSLGSVLEPMYREAGTNQLLSFDDLISLLTVRELRRAGVELADIKSAEQSLAHLWNVPRPFAHATIRTGYGAIVTALRDRERPVAVTSAVQELLYELIRHDLKDVSFDARKQARSWRPFGYTYVALRPDLQFGQPCIEGTRITTRTVHQFVAGGESFDELADDLEVSVEKLRDAFNYEDALWKHAN